MNSVKRILRHNLRRLLWALTLVTLVVSRAALAAPIVDVPLAYERGAVLVDHVRINGRGDYTFLLDTGSTACTLTPSVVEKLKLRKVGYSLVSAIGESRRLREVRVGRISLGAASVDAPLTLMAEDNGLSRHVGRTVHGVLGTPFLWKWPVEFDYPARRFRIHPPDYDLRTEPVEAPWSSVGTLTMRGKAAFIKVALNGGPARDMMVDTGATGLVIHKARAVEAKAFTPDLASTSLGSLGPSGKSTYWHIETVRFAGLTVEGAQAFTPHSFGDWRTDQLGNDALDQFRMTLDTGRRVMRLERDEIPERLDGYPWGVGIAVRRDMDGVRVAGVWPESDAAARGIAPGDMLLSIDGAAVMEMSDVDLRHKLNPLRDKPVKLEVRSDGSPARTLTLISHRYARKRPASSDETLATSLSVVQP